MAASQGLCVGLDVGTSGVKAVLVAEDGRVVASATADYPLLTPRPGWTEQEPERWWHASCDVLRRLVERAPGPIEAIGLTGQMHGAVFLDGQGGVIRPAILCLCCSGWSSRLRTPAPSRCRHSLTTVLFSSHDLAGKLMTV